MVFLQRSEYSAVSSVNANSIFSHQLSLSISEQNPSGVQMDNSSVQRTFAARRTFDPMGYSKCTFDSSNNEIIENYIQKKKQILGYDSLEIVPLFALIVLSFRKESLLQVNTLENIEALLADLSSIKVLPLLRLVLSQED